MNYMNEVAKMLGVELNEEFKISSQKGIQEGHVHRLTEHGLQFFHESVGEWWNSDGLCKLLDGSYEIVKPPILTEVERKYLSAVIKPFKDSVKYIVKYGSEDYEYVAISYSDEQLHGDYNVYLPTFKVGTKYQGMEQGRAYDLEELDLDKAVTDIIWC